MAIAGTTREWVLSTGQQSARISATGGRVLSYVVAEREVLAGKEPEEFPAYRSALLAPWPNRVADGTWQWEGQELTLPVNETDIGAALHGLVAYAPYEAVHVQAASLTMQHNLRPVEGYPFMLRIEAEYELTADGLNCALRAVNTGERSAPVGLGVHPYLDCRGPVDDVTLLVPARTLLVGDAAWREKGRIPSEGGRDFTTARLIGPDVIDAAWTDVIRSDDGNVRCEVGFADGQHVVLWGGDTCRWLVVYNGDTLPGQMWRRSMAVEPQTCPANALKSGTDLSVLGPGETLELLWGITPSWLSQE